jgi:hypothetical protein
MHKTHSSNEIFVKECPAVFSRLGNTDDVFPFSSSPYATRQPFLQYHLDSSLLQQPVPERLERARVILCCQPPSESISSIL